MYRVFKKKQPLIFNMFQEEDFRRLLLGAGFVGLEMTEINVWESIDVWINSYETTSLHRFEIRDLFKNAPAEARAVHPFKILPSGEIQDLWRWCIFSVRKPR
jgi:DNA gyrase subunit B